MKLLKQKCDPVTEEELFSILGDLEDSFEDLKERGYGLAAPQIGIMKQVAIIRAGGANVNLINPVIIKKENRTIFQKEGCLSFPGLFVDTDRYMEVLVETGIGDSRKQYYSYGIEAVIIQHEIDHLQGVLFLTKKHRSNRR